MPAENFEREAKTQTTDHSQSLFSDFWAGFKKGGVDELEYNKNHSEAAMMRAGMAAGVGYITAGKNSIGSTATKIGVVGGAVISAGHFVAPEHLEDMAKKNNADSTFGYLSGRYLADAIPTIALTTVANRASWNMKGEREIAAIIDRTEFKWGVHKVTHTESAISPVFKQERAEALFKFLEKRGQPEKFEGAVAKLALRQEPLNVSVIAREQGGSVGTYNRPFLSGAPVTREVPVFNPDELVLKAKAQVALRDLKGYNVFSDHW